MRSYTFYMHDAGVEVPSIGVFYCDTPESARATARWLVDHNPELLVVEVYDGDNWQFRLEKDRSDNQATAAISASGLVRL